MIAKNVKLNTDYPTFDSKEYFELGVCYPAGTQGKILEPCHMECPPHGIEFSELILREQLAKKKGCYLVLIEKSIVAIPSTILDIIREDDCAEEQQVPSAKQMIEKIKKG